MATDTMSEAEVRAEVAEETTRPTEAAAEHADEQRMYRFSSFVHVGPGAADCAEGENGACSDPLHFHAWCRLPNKFQHKDIRDKGLAAKARRIRALNDPEADAYLVLESELSEFTADRFEEVVNELVAREWAQDYTDAIADVSEQEEFAHIDQDRERYQRFIDEGEGDKPEDEQSDEFRELHRHVTRYLEAIKGAVTERQEPRREAIRALGFEQALRNLREMRVERIGDQTFIHTYNEWMWFIGTLRPAEGTAFERVWGAIGNADENKQGTMWGSAPEVIEAVERTFTELDREMQRAIQGNS
jgi:hypothetical protein